MKGHKFGVQFCTLIKFCNEENKTFKSGIKPMTNSIKITPLLDLVPEHKMLYHNFLKNLIKIKEQIGKQYSILGNAESLGQKDLNILIKCNIL